MHVVIPFAAKSPKTRLASVLDLNERREFAVAMLKDVLDIIKRTSHTLELLVGEQTSSLIKPYFEDTLPPIVAHDGTLSEAVNSRLDAQFDTVQPTGGVAVIMADLALLTVSAVNKLYTSDGDVVLAPGRGGGTNAFITRSSRFTVNYHGLSYQDHCEIAKKANLSFTTVDSMRLSTDIDEPDDLIEIRLHGDGYSHEWLKAHGFEIHSQTGRAAIIRRE
jgi:2-phospho-L-lactate guanylyltransferase